MGNESKTDGLGKRTRRALGWQYLSKGLNTALRMVTSIVLARLLMPEDFGIVAMATMVTGLARVFQDLGLGQALIQRQEIEDRHIRSAFWGTLIMGLMLWGALVLIAPLVGSYFSEPRMVPVLRVIALAFVLAPLSVVPRALLQRELNFRTMFLADSAGSVGYGAVGITMALLGYGYWSLVGAQLASAIFLAIALCILTGYIPPLVPTFSGIGELYGFGIGVTGVGLLTYLASQIDYFVIGRRLDAAALGLYRQAYNIVMMPVSMIARTIYPVLFPAFSALQDDLPRLRSAYGRVVATLCVIGFPALSLLSVSAPELIPVVLGEQWLEAVLPTQIMAFIGVQMLIGSPAGAAIKAVGKVYFEWWIQLARIVMLAPAVWYATRWGIAGVAWAVLGVYFLLLPLIVLFVRKGIGFGFIEMGRAVMPAVVIALCTIAGSEGVRLILLQHEVAPVIVVVSTLLVGVMVAFVIGWLWRPPGVMELVRAVGPRLRKWTGKQ